MLLWQAQKARTKLHRAAAEGGRIWLVGRWKEVVFGRFPDNLCRRRSSGGVWGYPDDLARRHDEAGRQQWLWKGVAGFNRSYKVVY